MRRMFSSPGIPKTTETPSFSRHLTISCAAVLNPPPPFGHGVPGDTSTRHRANDSKLLLLRFFDQECGCALEYIAFSGQRGQCRARLAEVILFSRRVVVFGYRNVLWLAWPCGCVLVIGSHPEARHGLGISAAVSLRVDNACHC